MSEAKEGAAPAGSDATEARSVPVERKDAPPSCANCGAALGGPYCANCGQKGQVHRDLRALAHDFAHGVFHFEGKFWRTLPMLAWRPGELTRRYIDGERAKFVSPMSLFLFSVFLMFAVVSNLAGQGGTAVSIASDASMTDSLAQSQLQRLAALEQQRAAAKDEAARQALDRQISGQRNAIGMLRDFKQSGARSGLPWFDRMAKHAFNNPDLLLYKMKSYAYKYSWALILVALPFIWLLFAFRRDVGLYDHAIFSIYSLSFMSMVVVALTLLGAIGLSSDLLTTAALLIPPVHIYRQLKGTYGLARYGALWRTAALLGITFFTSLVFVLFLFYIGSD